MEAGSRASQELQEVRPLPPGGRLEVRNFKGLIEIEPWERAEVEIRARIEAPEDVDEGYGRTIVEASALKIEAREGFVAVRADHSEVPPHPDPGWHRSGWTFTKRSKAVPDVTLKLRVPRELQLMIHDFKSRITLRDLTGAFDLQSFKSTVEARGLSGTLDWEDEKGALHLKGHRGSLRAQSVKGELQAELLELTGDSSVKVRGGQAEITLPASGGFSLRAELGKWTSIESDFDLTPEPGTRRTLVAEVEGGGPSLELRAPRGSVRLRRR